MTADSPDVFDGAVEQLKRSRDLSLSKDMPLAALILLYAAIDIVSALDREEGKDENSREDFKAWVNRYLLPVSGSPTLTAVDLYGARCSLVHAFTFESRLSRKGEAETLNYCYRNADDRVLAELYRQTKVGKPVRIENLFTAFDSGVQKFRADVLADPARSELVFGRAQKTYYAFVPAT